MSSNMQKCILREILSGTFHTHLLGWLVSERLLWLRNFLSYFECRAGVAVGRKPRYNEILQNILAQVDPNITCRMLTEGDDEKIGRKLKERWERKRCLILLDDVWDTEVMDHLRNYLPDVNDGMVRVLRVIKFLNEEESTYLLHLKVFGEDDFPYQLEKAGKKIAKNCEGLPLLILERGRRKAKLSFHGCI